MSRSSARKHPSVPPCLLTINGGSSSIRFAGFEWGPPLRRVLTGKAEWIGRRGPLVISVIAAGAAPVRERWGGVDRRHRAVRLWRWFEAQPFFAGVTAVGHRVVHGLRHTEPARVTPRLLAELRRLTPYDPEHLPGEIALMAAGCARHPGLPQVACFDTAFHRTLPRVARLLAIPRRFAARGMVRYGFHGLSYAYLLEELARLDPAAAAGRVIFAHLGHGASLAAVRGGRCVDTSMGFTPAGGLVMGTRAGDLDPGVFAFLVRHERLTPAAISRILHHESGLRGVSGRSSDLRVLLAHEDRDERAAEAVALFCAQARKWLGAFAAVLGGVDTLVFAGGIGENSPVIRARICAGLGFLGVVLHRARNGRNAGVISTDAGRVTVRVIRTDEEIMIARAVGRTLAPDA